MCSAHATVRGLLGEIVARTGNGRDIIVDMEAGLEHLSRGTGKHVSRIVAVVEPYFRSLETGRRVKELATELGIGDVVGIANKVRDDADRRAIQDFCAAHGLPLLGEIPYDPTLVESERVGRPPIEHLPPGPAVAAIRGLAEHLIEDGGKG